MSVVRSSRTGRSFAMLSRGSVWATVATLWTATGCGAGARPTIASHAPSSSPSLASAPPTAPASPMVDPLGPRPEPPLAPPFLPPAPGTFSAVGGLRVWMLERHDVPIVSCQMTVPAGASSDPKGRGGLAYVTAAMLDEGAGSRGAIDLARAFADLGARIETDADADASFVSMTVLKRNLDRAFALFGDVVARPRFDPKELKRFGDLWQSALLEREKEPEATAHVVDRVTLFGPDHPYGHPWDGTLQSAKAITLDDVRRFYASAWRPDRATLVCAGDVTQGELAKLIDAAFTSWKAPPGSPPAPVTPSAPVGPWPKLVLVDRPDAPQSVIAVVKPGIAVSDPDEPALWRVNDVIGGSFTSRLNQDLREKKGYTYGARSVYSVSRGPGMVVSYASVVTDKTGDALGAMLSDLHTFAQGGMSDAEVALSRSQARGSVVALYETVERIAGHLAAGASLGLAPGFEADVAHARDEAQKPLLDALAKRFYDPHGSIVVVVGPRDRVEPMIEKLGLPPPEMRDASGVPVH